MCNSHNYTMRHVSTYHTYKKTKFLLADGVFNSISIPFPTDIFSFSAGKLHWCACQTLTLSKVFRQF